MLGIGRKIKKILNLSNNDVQNSLKIYPPLYNPTLVPSSNIPEIYNKYGEKMDLFFLRDSHAAHSPYGRKSMYFLWDRYNYGLNTHFYTHNAMLETMGTPTHKYGMLLESKSITPNDYNLFNTHKGLETEFDAIFTYDEELLNKLSNAKFFPSCANLWYKYLNAEAYMTKTKNISIVSSDKVICDLHKVRIAFAHKCKNSNLADTYGTFDGGSNIDIADSLTDYRYSIAIENYVSGYFFTEKITNCFASMTVPIYIGANKIDTFFNPNGIIQIKPTDLDNLEKILKRCTEKDYEDRREAIIDNYNRVIEYMNMDDYLYKHYFLGPLSNVG